MMNETTQEIEGGVVFLVTTDLPEEFPDAMQFRPGVMVLTAPQCLLIGTQIDLDGPVTLSIGDQTVEGLDVRAEGTLDAADGFVRMETYVGEPLLQASVPPGSCRYRISSDRVISASRVHVAVGLG